MITNKLIKSLVIFFGLFCCSNFLGYGQKIIAWKDAHKYYGKIITVEGTIVDTHNSGRACFLNFHPDYKKYFSVVIFRSDFHRFPDAPEDYYLNKKVQVSGTIKEYQGKPEIVLKDTSNIKIIGISEEPKKILEISWEDADKHYGEHCCVKGKIVYTYNSGRACFLNFHKNWTRYFTAVIFASNFHKFPPSPETHYLEKMVKISGIIKEYQGKPEIIVNNPKQIQIVK